MQNDEKKTKTDILSYGDKIMASITRKANKHKRMTRAATWGLTACGVAIPVVLAVPNFEYAKIVAAILGALTAMVPTFIGLEQPHERWKMYRRYQRQLEAQRARFENNIAPYDNPGDQCEKYILKLEEEQLLLHQEWEALVVTKENIDAQVRP